MCTDGAPAMLGSPSGFVKLAKDKNPSIIGSHCVIHRQALASKTLPSEIKNVLEICIKVVNTVKSSALNSHLFNILCSELSAHHSVLLLHTEVRWLSKRNMFERMYEFKSEVEIMLLKLGKDDLREHFTDENFTFHFAYLTDFFETINNVNLKLKGRNTCPLSTNVDTLPDIIQEQAIELKNDSRAKIDFNSGSSLEEFWVKYQPIYPEISN